MRKPDRFALWLCLLAVGVMPLQAQEVLFFNWTAEVVEAGGANTALTDDIQVGHTLTGILAYNPTLEPLPENGQERHVYNLGADPASRLDMNVSGHDFNVITHSGDVGITAGFTANLFSSLDASGQRCQKAFHLVAESLIVDDDNETKHNFVEFYLDDWDCEGEYDSSYLPSNFTLADWENAEVKISVYDNPGGDFWMRARITSLSLGAAGGATVSGTVFGDYDGDCSLNGMDAGLNQRFVKFTPGPFTAITDAQGTYSISLPPGDYQAEVVERPLWETICPAATVSISLPTAESSETLDFGLEPTTLTEAASTSLAGSLPRPGFAMSYTIRVRNTGTLPYSGTVRFTHDNLLTDFSAEPQADSYIAPTAEWEIADLPVGAVRTITVTLQVPADETLLGTIVCATVASESSDKAGDELLQESEDELCMEIRGAFDPNDIQVFSGTRNADGVILPEDVVLTYLIRFQNEGNAEAINIRVVDRLSEFHNVDKVRIGAASHDFVFNIKDGGTLEWTFNNINLPSKGEDELGSKGYIAFDVHLKAGLPVDTEIPNAADIYFDFNSPVRTNTVVSRILNSVTSVDDDMDAVAVQLFPNPTSDKLTVRFEQTQTAELSLNNLMGATVLSQRFHGSAQELDLTAFAAGAYYLTIRTAQGVTVRPINIAR